MDKEVTIVSKPVVEVRITSSLSSVQMMNRFNRGITISELKARLETIVGAPASSMELEIFSGCDKFLQKMENDDALLGSYPVDDNCRIHVIDKSGGQMGEFYDVSKVEKFELPDEAYEQKSDSVRAFLKKQRLGRFNEEEMAKKQADLAAHEEEQDQLAGLGSNLVTEVRVYNWFANRRKEDAFKHRLSLDTPYANQSASSNTALSASPEHGVKFTQQMSGDTVSSARGSGGERAGRLMVSPIQLEPSHTLLESHNPKLVSSSGPLPPVSTLTSLHSLSASPASSQSLIMASVPGVMSLGESSLLIGLASTQPQTVPVINNMGGGFTTLQPISFQQQLHASHQQPISQQLQGHMAASPLMATMAQLPYHMYKSDSPPYHSSSLLSQAMVIADSSGLGTLTSLAAVRQILTTDPEEQTDPPLQEDSMHLQPHTPVPASSESLELYSSSQTTERHQSLLLSPSQTDISSYMPTQMVSTAQ